MNVRSVLRALTAVLLVFFFGLVSTVGAQMPLSHTPAKATSTPKIKKTPVKPTVSFSKRANVRSGPGTGYGVLLAANSGLQLEVTGKVMMNDGLWWQVRLPDGKVGWVRNDVVWENFKEGEVKQVEADKLPATPTKAPSKPAPVKAESGSVIGKKFTLQRNVQMATDVGGPIGPGYVGAGKQVTVVGESGGRWEVRVDGNNRAFWMEKDPTALGVSSQGGGKVEQAGKPNGTSAIAGEYPDWIDNPHNFGHWRIIKASMNPAEMGTEMAYCGIVDAVWRNGNILVTLKAAPDGDNRPMYVLLSPGSSVFAQRNSTLEMKGVSLAELAATLMRRGNAKVFITQDAFGSWQQQGLGSTAENPISPVVFTNKIMD